MKAVRLIDLYWALHQNQVHIGTYDEMAKNTSITLGEHFDGFITHQLESGRYASASEIVRAGLRLLEDTENKLQALQHMLTEGEASGIAEYSYETFIAEMDEAASR